ncbi:hypothetical protein GW17_00062488 [Ensete ventricosum]|nr:hypothetical protein GW17_00062488 [Ensete ventricosum]
MIILSQNDALALFPYLQYIVVVAAALGRNLVGGRCRLAWVLPLQERMLAVAPARGFGRGRPPPYRGPWLQPVDPCSQPFMGAVVAGRPSSLLPSLRKHNKNA